MISDFAQRFYAKNQKHAPKILLGIGLLWLLLLFALSTFPIEKSSAAFFPDNSAELQSMVHAMDTVQFSQYVYVDFSIKQQDSAHGQSMEDLATHIKAVEAKLDPQFFSVQKSPTLPDPQDIFALLPALFTASMEKNLQERMNADFVQQNLQNAYGMLMGFSASATLPWLRHDPLHFRDVLMPLMPNSQGILPPDPQLGYALSKDKKHLLLVLRPQISMHQTEFALAAMQNLHTALATLPDTIATITLGGLRHTAANTEAIDSDILWISTISLLGIAIIYLIFIRSLGGFWLLLTPCLAVSIAFAMVHILFGLVSGLALGFGMAILGIAEDYAVHMHFGLRSNTQKNVVFKALSAPLFQGFLLNASGFALLLFSAIPAVRQLSAFAIAALGSGFLLALFILPLCPGFDKPQKNHTDNQAHPQLFPKLWPTICLGLCLGFVSSVFFALLPMDVSPKSMGADMQNIQDDSIKFNNIWHFLSPSLILVDAKDNTSALEKTDSLQNALQKNLPKVRITSMATFVPNAATMQKNMERWQNFITKNTEFITQNFSTVHNGLDPKQIFAPFLAFWHEKPEAITLEKLQAGPFQNAVHSLLQPYAHKDMVQSRIIVETDLQGKELSALAQGVDLSHVTLFTPHGLEKILSGVFYTEARYIPLMFAFCLVLLFFCFKNIGQTVLAALPAAGALFCILASMYALQKPLTLASLAAMPLVLGLSIDHGIMATHHLAKGIPLQMDRAILVSSLTACVSMGMLAFASHPALQSMGHVVFVGLLVEMPISLWLLPRLCKERV